MNNIYTTYIAKAKDLPEDITKIYICRFLPKSLELKLGDFHMNILSPEAVPLRMYKSEEITFEKLMELFLAKLNSEEYSWVRESLARSRFKDVCLICYEKDASMCHRSYAAQFVASATGGTYKGEYKYEN